MKGIVSKLSTTFSVLDVLTLINSACKKNYRLTKKSAFEFMVQLSIKFGGLELLPLILEIGERNIDESTGRKFATNSNR